MPTASGMKVSLLRFGCLDAVADPHAVYSIIYNSEEGFCCGECSLKKDAFAGGA